MRKGNEECDDGNTDSGDGCSSSCEVEEGYSCGGAGGYWMCDGPGDQCESGCGTGTMEEGTVKECDDGNTEGGDGCSRTCRIECGWECAGGEADSPDGCFAGACGDSALGGMEECDDGNVMDGDGCSSSCKIETGYSCWHYASPPYPCGAYGDWCSEVCGDGLLVGSEIGQDGYCDDGNTASGDGCSSGCQVECGYTCGGSREACELQTVCGDGLVAGSEECDDGNAADGDGCSSTCVVEGGWTCTAATCGRSWCTSECGDGLLVGPEECDDGNTDWYDGCSGACKVECGWDCSGGS